MVTMKDLRQFSHRQLVLLLLSAPLLLGAKGDQWRRVAESEVRFAIGLAELHVRFGPTFAKLISESTDGCGPVDYKLAGLDDNEQKQVRLYSDYFCAPWAEEWGKIIRTCDQEPGPKWCEGDEEGEKHLQFHNYFDVMQEALRTTSDRVGRFNIMAGVGVRLSDKVFRDFTEAMVDKWVIPTATEFMKSAPPDDVMVVAKVLDASVYGYSKGIAAAFASFAEKSADFSVEQREELKKMAIHADVSR